MKIGIIGSGNIGSTEGKLWIKAGHDVMYGSDNVQRLRTKGLSRKAKMGTISEAIAFGDVILIALPWEVAEDLLEDSSPFGGKIIIDATNPYTVKDPTKPRTGDNTYLFTPPDGSSATAYRSKKLPEVPLVKAYNSLTAQFQKEAAGRNSNNRVVMPYAGNNQEAKQVVAQLIKDSGFAPYDVGDADAARFIEPPRGDRSLYGEEWSLNTIQSRLQDLR